jgi:energy-coupling factor transporter ATP-binding protein EcfA2
MATTTTKKAPAGSFAKSAEDRALDEVMAHAFGTAAAAAPEVPVVPAFAAPALVLKDGERMFSEVFGWMPETLPRDIPVRVFESTDWPEAIRPFIPAALPEGELWHWPRKATELFALAMYAGDRTLVHGPTGSGKSALVQAWAHMCSIPLIRVNCHREQQSTDFLGKDIITANADGANVLVYDWSLTTLAAKQGGMLLLDEAFRSPVLMAVQSLLERNGTLTLPDAASLTPEQRRIVPPAGRFWIALTDNTNGTGDESGAYNAEVQDLSTLGRITATIEVPYMSAEDQLAQLAKVASDVPSATLKVLADWAQAMRSAFVNKAVMQPICLRVLLSILAKYRIVGDLKLSIGLAYCSKLGPHDKLVASEAYQQLTGEALEESAEVSL